MVRFLNTPQEQENGSREAKDSSLGRRPADWMLTIEEHGV